MERLVAFFILTVLLGVVGAKQCIDNRGQKKCEQETSAANCTTVGETCLQLASGQSGKFDGVCGPPQGEGCDCDPHLTSPETCQAGLSCQPTKCSPNGCKYECGQLSDEDQLLQCRDDGGDSNQWRLVYKHDAFGASEEGSLADLIALVVAGADIKVRTHLGQHRVQKVSVGTFEEAVYAQVLFFMPYFIPGSRAFSLYFVTSTTGNFHVTSLTPGQPEPEENAKWPPYNNNEYLRAFKWFARDSNLQLSAPSAMATAFRDGATGSAFWAGALRHLDALSVEGDIMCGQNVWEMKDSLAGREFYPLDSAHFSNMCSDGLMEGKYVLMNTNDVNDTISNDVSSATWFADTCWEFVYRQDADGRTVSGSLDALVDMARDGKPIMVRIDDVYHKVSKLVIADDASWVSAQVFDHFHPDLTPPTLRWLDVTTDYGVTEISVNVGVSEYVTVPLRRQVAWFADSRAWSLDYHSDMSGDVVTGSSDDVYTAYNGGADIRVGISRQPGAPLEIYQPDSVGEVTFNMTAYNDREFAIGDDGDELYHVRSWFLSTGIFRQKVYMAEGVHVEDVPPETVEMRWWSNGFESA